MQEWPLIIFTLLVQGSVGITAALSLFLIFGRTTMTATEQRRYALPPLLVAVVAAAIGLAASTLHLGYPLNAFNSLRHFASSWLSREIIFASLYLAAVGLAALIALFLRKLSLALLLIGSVLGIIDVFCMGAIYFHSSVATWMHINTWVMFYGAALSIGATVALWAFAARSALSEKIKRQATSCALTVLIAATAVRVLEQLAYFSYLATANSSQVETFPHQPLVAFEQLHTLYTASWVVLIVGVVLQGQFLRTKGSKTVLTVGCCAVLLAEILLRTVFFSIN